MAKGCLHRGLHRRALARVQGQEILSCIVGDPDFARHFWLEYGQSLVRASTVNRRFWLFRTAHRFRASLTLHWGVFPIVIPFDQAGLEKNIAEAMQVLLAKGLLVKGNTAVVISSFTAGDQVVDAVQMRVVK